MTASELLVNAILDQDVAECRRQLVEGADADAKDIKGRPAIILAASRQDSMVVKLLLEYGADAHARLTLAQDKLNDAPVIGLPAGQFSS